MRQDREIEDCDDMYPSTLKPWWTRNKKARREHELDILLAGIAGVVLAALILFKVLRP